MYIAAVSAMYIAAAMNVVRRLVPAVKSLHDAIDAKAREREAIPLLCQPAR